MAIPRGTLLAIVITGIVYIGVAISAGKWHPVELALYSIHVFKYN